MQWPLAIIVDGAAGETFPFVGSSDWQADTQDSMWGHITKLSVMDAGSAGGPERRESSSGQGEEGDGSRTGRVHRRDECED